MCSGKKTQLKKTMRARREEDQKEEDYIFRPARSLQFQNGADKRLWIADGHAHDDV
jgi:hypothetical protein